MICFIILHYIVKEETEKCIKSIKNIIKEDKKIIIVDNLSPNNSGKELLEEYKNDLEVDVLLNDSNAGFACGNNYGYRYVKKTYNPEFIIVMNNDVELIQKDFYKILKSAYEREEFYILGPDIYSTTYQIHQSPKRLSGYTYDEVLKLYNKYKKELQSYFFTNIKCLIKNIKGIQRKVYYNRRKKIDSKKIYYNVPLHGSCIIFSSKYIEKYNFIFNEGTFFYYECEILDYFCKIEKLKTVYTPELKVEHHQNVSTNIAYKNMRKKTDFANKCNVQSTRVFLEYIENANRINDNNR